jgi:hypothetical protein
MEGVISSSTKASFILGGEILVFDLVLKASSNVEGGWLLLSLLYIY